jgi:hypothetical protein
MLESIARMQEACAKLQATLECLLEQRQRLLSQATPNTERAMMAGDDLPRWTPKRAHTVQKTQYLRRDYNAGDVAILRQMASAQLEWTFEQVIARKNELRGRK